MLPLLTSDRTRFPAELVVLPFLHPEGLAVELLSLQALPLSSEVQVFVQEQACLLRDSVVMEARRLVRDSEEALPDLVFRDPALGKEVEELPENLVDLLVVAELLRNLEYQL